MNKLTMSGKPTAGAVLPVLLLSLLLLAMPAFASTPAHESVKKACESLTKDDFQKYNFDKKYVRNLQGVLEKTFGISVGPEGQDGIIGAHTTGALKAFCVRSTLRPMEKERLADVVVATVLQYGVIADAFPDAWQSIFSAAVTEVGRTEKVFRVGEEPPAPVTPDSNEGLAVSYQLTEGDLKVLEDLGKQDPIARLQEALKGKTFEDKQAFIAELENVIAADPPPTEEQIQETKIYLLTEQSFAQPVVRSLPGAILEQLKKLENVEYASRKELTDALAAIIRDSANKYVSVIVQSAEKTAVGAKPTPNETQTGDAPAQEEAKKNDEPAQKKTVFELTEKSFVALLGSDVPEAVLKKLQGLKNKPYDKQDDLVQAVRAVVEPVTKKYQSDLAEFIEERRRYGLSDAYRKSLEGKRKTQPIPDLVLWALETGFKDLEYPDRRLFVRALRAGLYPTFERAVIGSAERRSPLRLTDDSFDELKALGMPAATLDGLQALNGASYADEQRLAEALAERFKPTFDQYAADPVIVNQARKRHEFAMGAAPNWQGRANGEACGCVSEDLAGVVYGFYPFWMADGEKPAAGEQKVDGNDEAAGVQFIDFSRLSRIGFHAVTFDADGNLEEPENARAGQADFVREANRYRTQLDLVVFRNDWQGWFDDAGERAAEVVDRLVTRIVDRIDQPLADFRSRIRPYISFGGAAVPSLADGVAIQFDGAADGVAQFAGFIRTLKQRMMAGREGRRLSVMLMMPLEQAVQVIREIEQDPGKIEIGVDAATGRVKSVLVDQRVAPSKVAVKAADHYLVFLAEPTTESKKRLRLLIERAFKGDQRAKVLRRIVPVITPGGRDPRRLHDDLVYFKDNFGGAGFWPLPLKSRYAAAEANAITDAVAARVNRGLDEAFQRGSEFYQVAEDGGLSETLCTLVCPNRWVVRIIADLFLLIVLSVILAYWFVCRMQLLFWKYFPYFIAVAVLAILWWFLMLYCDPFYEWLRVGNLPLIIVVAAVIVSSIMQYVSRRKRGAVP